MDMNHQLYQWQEACLRQWFSNDSKGIVQAATGSGKTFLALVAADRLEQTLAQKLCVKVVVPTETLMYQWNRAIKDYFSSRAIQKTVGLRGGSRKSSTDCDYMIYIINSARYELARQILMDLKAGNAVLLIADECHRYGSGQNQLIFEFLPYSKPYMKSFFSLGLTATLPSGQLKQYLMSVLGRTIYNYSIDQASKMQTVCPYDIFHIALSFQRKEREEYEYYSERMMLLYHRLQNVYPIIRQLTQKELFDLLRHLSQNKEKHIAEAASVYMQLSYQRRSLVCLAAARMDCVWDLTERLSLKEKIIIFGERIKQAEELYQLFQKRYPGKVGRYHSKLSKGVNKNTLERFRDGEIRILIACKAVDEGIDVPDASVGIILSGTSAQRQRIQRLGRIIRKKEGKEKASLYYLHITETSEDSCYLPDGKISRVIELKYDSARGLFLHPSYDKASDILIQQMRGSGMKPEQIREAGYCLELGSVRSDWSLEQDTIAKHIREAASVRERNYWICMKKLQQIAILSSL